MPPEPKTEKRPSWAVACTNCDGSGRSPFNSSCPGFTYECTVCDGKGWLRPKPLPVDQMAQLMIQPIEPTKTIIESLLELRSAFIAETKREPTTICLTELSERELRRLLLNRMSPQDQHCLYNADIRIWLPREPLLLPLELQGLAFFWGMSADAVCTHDTAPKPADRFSVPPFAELALPLIAKTELVTPDQYRYAKAHLRAALDHLDLAVHYMRSDPTTVIVGNHACAIKDLCKYAEEASLKKDS